MRRPARVAELLRDEITELVGFELNDPRLEAVTVTDVRVADNLRDARIFVLVEGNELQITAALAALSHAAPYIRRQLTLSLNLRHTPTLYFVRDTVEERAGRIDVLLSEIEREWKDRE
jgi:ribosome-binding factor A